MTCTMTPMEGLSADMFRMCCENMMRMMEMGMPCMMMCGGMMLVGMSSAMGAQTKPMKKSA
jgi:short-subunit dehydrogenase